MSALSWRLSLVVHGYVYTSGDRVPVAVGLVDNAAGDTTVAVRVGAGPWVLLPIGEAGRLGVNVQAVLAERFQLAEDTFGGRVEREDRGDGGDSSR